MTRFMGTRMRRPVDIFGRGGGCWLLIAVGKVIIQLDAHDGPRACDSGIGECPCFLHLEEPEMLNFETCSQHGTSYATDDTAGGQRPVLAFEIGEMKSKMGVVSIRR